MGYAETLSKIVSESGLSLREIAERCNAKGQPINPSYISKLQTGKQAPGSEDISRTIAEVCGGDPDILVWEGYMEKAPEIIRQYIQNTLPILRQSMFQALNLVLPPNQVELLGIQLNDMSPIEFMRMINENDSSELNMGVDEFNLVDLDNPEVNVNVSEVIGIPLIDDSMAPTIPYKATVKFVPIEGTPQNGTVIAFKKNGQFLVRYFYQDGKNIILVPENNKYYPILCPLNDIQISGKVKSYTVTL